MTRMKSKKLVVGRPAPALPVRKLARLGYAGLFLCGSIFLMVGPLVVVVLASTSTTRFSVFPPVGFTLRWYVEALGQEEVRAAATYSFWLALLAALISTSLALLFALGLEAVERTRFIVRNIHRVFSSAGRATLMLPLMFPAIVVAVALLDFFSRLALSGSPYVLLVAHTIYVLPFAFTLVEIGLASAPDELRRSAQSLGANPWQTVLYVVLPAARLGIGAAFGLTFIISFGEVTLALFLHVPDSVTLPIYIYNSLYANPLTPDITAVSGAITLMTIGLMTVVLVAARKVLEGNSPD